MYEVIAKLDKQNRVTIPEVIRELICAGPGDVVKIIVVEKVDAKAKSSENPLEALAAPASA